MLLLTFKLHSKGNHNVESFETDLKVVNYGDFSGTEGSTSKIFRHEGLRSDKAHVVTKCEVTPYAAASNARMTNIAHEAQSAVNA